jgi:hypothetical protein
MEGLARFDQAGSRGEQRKLTESTNPVSGRQGGSRRAILTLIDRHIRGQDQLVSTAGHCSQYRLQIATACTRPSTTP